MSSRQRIVLLAIAAVVLVGGILIASSGGDDGTGSSETTAAQTTPAETGAQPEATGRDAETTEEKPAEPKPRVETIEMRDRAPVGEPQTLEYERGETIRLRFVSDVAEEVHIHGFDRYVQVPAGEKPKTERFDADLEGIFEVEAHSSGELLAKLEIRPK